MIDVEKFICSLLEDHPEGVTVRRDIHKALRDQGLEYKDGKIVETRFKIGDLITNGILVGEIDEIHELGYHAYFGDYYADVPDIENWHKWTIQDAKDGDVLCSESGWACIFKSLNDGDTFSSYCFMDSTKWFCEEGSECHTLSKEFMKAYNRELKPATKEQREKLFAAMADAGYKWDAENKQLRKIEQNPAWSEEDERMYKAISIALTFNDAKGYLSSWYKTPEEADNWLISLKNRVGRETNCTTMWKPSDMQIMALRWVLNNVPYNKYKEEISGLLEKMLEQLKKLKGDEHANE